MYKNLYKELIDRVNEKSQCIMLTYLTQNTEREGTIRNKVLLNSEDVDKNTYQLSSELHEKISYSLETGKLQFINVGNGEAVLIEPFFQKPRLIVFGGGHIAKPLVDFAARVGFSVTVIDDRPSFANSERFPRADRIICEDFKKSFDLINLRKTDFVVIITRGHRYDGIVIREVLKHDLSYIGMIGSRRRVRAMMEELSEEGFSQERISKVNAPIGLDIGAITPDEIAISIVAQLISYKNQVVNKLGKDFTFPEFDIEVAEKINEESTIPWALITILSTKGSVPRKAGAKMIAYYDGRTVGSIGGGCSEAEVITRARDVMLTKGFAIQRVDMTGDVAESEGMVCGGIMEVLIEAF